MNRLKSPYFWFAFIPGLFVVVVLCLFVLQKEYRVDKEVEQDGLEYRIRTVNRWFKTKSITVSVVGSLNVRATNEIIIPLTLNVDGVTYSVTQIGKGAFYMFENLTSVTIPDSVTQIEQYAFNNCTSLTNLIISKSITSIDEGVFNSCTNLTSLTIPDNVTQIGVDAFENCTGLTNVIIGRKVTLIRKGAFGNCTNLKAIYFKVQRPSFGEDSFNKNAVLYYVEGTPGWTTPTCKGYTTKTWTPKP